MRSTGEWMIRYLRPVKAGQVAKSVRCRRRLAHETGMWLTASETWYLSRVRNMYGISFRASFAGTGQAT